MDKVQNLFYLYNNHRQNPSEPISFLASFH
jgi:hypothetical protein